MADLDNQQHPEIGTASQEPSERVSNTFFFFLCSLLIRLRLCYDGHEDEQEWYILKWILLTD